MKHAIKSLKEMEIFANSCAVRFSKEAHKDRATVVGLYGDLGAGKTAFVKALARACGVHEHITSPTFVIMKRFEMHDMHFKNLIHIDAYRLHSGEELRKLGFENLLNDPQNIIFIEWANLVADILPPDHIKLNFTFVDENTREVVE